jgi:hypothetical protein
VEQLCALLTEFREDWRAFTTPRHSELRRCLGALGMTPADRSKVSVPRPASNPFEGL